MQLSNMQQELLKIYSFGIPDKDLVEIRNILADYFANKATEEANKGWKEKKLTNDDMLNWLNEKS